MHVGAAGGSAAPVDGPKAETRPGKETRAEENGKNTQVSAVPNEYHSHTPSICIPLRKDEVVYYAYQRNGRKMIPPPD